MSSMNPAGLSRRVLDVALVVGLAALASLPRPRVWTALPVAVIALAVGRRRDGVRLGAVALVLLVAGSLAGPAAQGRAWQDGAVELPFALLRAGVPWLIGVAWRLRTQVRDQARERIDRQRRERRAAIRAERDAERLALAETLHDDLGHRLSLVALNLGRLEVDPTVEPATRVSVAEARRELSVAVERLGASVVRLRRGTAPGPAGGGTDPGPPEDRDVVGLLERARRAGAQLTVRGLPCARGLGEVGREALTRVVREGLTNAARHAPGRPIDIDVAEADDGVEVLLRNPVGEPARPGGGSGTGLAALTRHLQTLGGHLEARVEDATFTVRARVPDRSATRQPAGSPAWSDGEELDAALRAGARRRGRLVLAAAVGIALVALGAVEAVTSAEARRAVLPVEAFVQIRPGDPREDVERVLPDREADPGAGGAHGGCHVYAVSAGPFEEASGDVYRICFADDVVTAAEYVGAPGR